MSFNSTANNTIPENRESTLEDNNILIDFEDLDEPTDAQIEGINPAANIDEFVLEDNPGDLRFSAPLASNLSRSTPKTRSRKRSSRARARRTDASTVMLTGDPVRMYLKEIGKVDLLTAAEEGEVELTRTEQRRLMRIEQVGLEAKQALISADRVRVIKSKSSARLRQPIYCHSIEDCRE